MLISLCHLQNTEQRPPQVVTHWKLVCTSKLKKLFSYTNTYHFLCNRSLLSFLCILVDELMVALGV